MGSHGPDGPQAETFEELVGRHLDNLYSAALCFARDPHRAEEILQEAAIRGFHEFSRRTDRVPFREWMLGLLVSTYRSREARGGADPLPAEGPGGIEVGEGAEPSTRAPRLPEPDSPAYRALGDSVERAWAELDPGDRVVTWLCDVERLDHARVARMLDVPKGHVRRRHHRARRSLASRAKEMLGERGAGD
jgi:RNA polymerase sigma factor (sigma-70 family)